MAFKSIIRFAKLAAPVIIANAPAVIAAFKEAKKSAQTRQKAKTPPRKS